MSRVAFHIGILRDYMGKMQITKSAHLVPTGYTLSLQHTKALPCCTSAAAPVLSVHLSPLSSLQAQLLTISPPLVELVQRACAVCVCVCVHLKHCCACVCVCVCVCSLLCVFTG